MYAINKTNRQTINNNTIRNIQLAAVKYTNCVHTFAKYTYAFLPSPNDFGVHQIPTDTRAFEQNDDNQYTNGEQVLDGINWISL